jgi:hypothetical protein
MRSLNKGHSFLIVLCAVVIVKSAMACIDAPTPVKLKGGTFESVAMQVSSSGLNAGNRQIAFDKVRNLWCVRNYEINKNDCGYPQHLVRDSSDNIVGIISFDNKNRKAILRQVKKPFSKQSFEADDSVPRVEFTDESDAGNDPFQGKEIFVTRARKADGTAMGGVTSVLTRGTRAIRPPQDNKPLDLTDSKDYRKGCGGESEEKKEDFKFEIGDSH